LGPEIRVCYAGGGAGIPALPDSRDAPVAPEPGGAWGTILILL